MVIFPRQSGKNETQAMLESYLLLVSARANGEMVKVSPTWKPQSQNAMHRLERRLRNSLLVWCKWRKEQGYIYTMGSARMTFLSASPTANVVGATATLLLECDEAQDVLPEKWDKEINPMAASSNATRVFWGTAWTSSTLLAREMRRALAAQDADGIQRLFRVTADEVGREVPAYLRFVRGEIARQGRNHPHVKTQYFCEEIEAAGGMFPPQRLALMQGDHDPSSSPRLGSVYAFLLDLAGEDETVEGMDWQMSGGMGTGEHGLRRDATALTVVEVDPRSAADELLRLPTYRVIQRRAWTGIRQARLYGLLRAMGELWRPRCLGGGCDRGRGGDGQLPGAGFPRQGHRLRLQRCQQEQAWLGFPGSGGNRPVQGLPVARSTRHGPGSAHRVQPRAALLRDGSDSRTRAPHALGRAGWQARSGIGGMGAR